MNSSHALGLLVAGFLSTTLHAAVILNSFPMPLEIRDDFFGRYDPVDLNSDGITDFTFSTDPSYVALRTELANRAIIRLDGGHDIGGPITPLESGYAIGSALLPGSNWPLLWASSDFLGGYVSPGENSFTGIVSVLTSGSSTDFRGRAPIGVEFAAADGLHYGYLDISAGPGYGGFTFYGWAYESQPGVPIVAGAVPEPSSLLLASSGLLAVASKRWRNARRSDERQFERVHA